MSEEYYPESGMKIFIKNHHAGYLALVFGFLIVLSGRDAGIAYGSRPGVLEGQIFDIAEQPVKGAEVYIFDSTDVKRPADFISNRTLEDGRFKVLLPAGNYWAVAIFRQGGGRFGPLASGDKHSGEPLALEIKTDVVRQMDFMVVDLQEAARRHQKKSDDLVRISGRLIDDRGEPVALAYAMASKTERFGALPEYISAWTDSQGEYVLYLPPGRYYLGAAIGFPPKHGYILKLDQQFVGDTKDLNIVVNNKKLKIED